MAVEPTKDAVSRSLGATVTTSDDPSDDTLEGVGRNAAWMSLQLVAQALGQVAVAAIAVRSIGAAAFGQAALVLAIAALVQVVDVGLSALIVREVARLRSDDSALRESTRQQIQAAEGLYVCVAGAAILGGGVSTTVVLVAGGASRTAWTIALVALGTAMFAVGSPPAGVLTGMARFRSLSLAACAGAVLNVLLVWATSSKLGPAGVALGYMAGAGVQRLFTLVAARRAAPWVSFRPTAPRREALAPLVRYSAPLIGVSVVSQAVSASDLIVLSVAASAGAVGLYRLGSTVPTWLVGAMFRLFDVVFPGLAGAESRESRLSALRLLTRIVSVVAGLVFGILIFERDFVMRLLAGPDHGDLATDVLAVFAATWALQVPGHAVVLLLMAEARHGFLPKVVGAEGLLNIVLSVAFVVTIGPVGVAWATLVTLAVSNIAVLPRLAEHRVPGSATLVYRHGLGGLGVGAAAAVLGSLAAESVADGSGRSIVAGAVGAALLVPAVAVLTSPAERLRLRRATTSRRTTGPPVRDAGQVPEIR